MTFVTINDIANLVDSAKEDEKQRVQTAFGSMTRHQLDFVNSDASSPEEKEQLFERLGETFRVATRDGVRSIDMSTSTQNSAPAAALPSGNKTTTDASDAKAKKVQEDLNAAMELISALVSDDSNVIYHANGDINTEATIANVRDARKDHEKLLNAVKRDLEAVKKERDSAKEELKQEQSKATATTAIPSDSILVNKAQLKKQTETVKAALDGDYPTLKGVKAKLSVKGKEVDPNISWIVPVEDVQKAEAVILELEKLAS